jgi:alpha-galactosidase
VALTGHLGVELDVRKMDAAQRARLAQWLALYKSVRHLQGRGCWRGEAGDSVSWTAMGGEDEALLCLYRLQPTTWRYPPVASLPFVDADAQYRVQRIDPPPVDVHSHGNSLQPRHGAPWDRPLQVDGRWLRELGLVTPALQAESAALFLLRRC